MVEPLSDSDLRIVIMSRKRSETCRHVAEVLARSATVCIAESEAADYAWAGSRLVTHPDHVDGMGPVRHWILTHFTERAVVLLDDDVKHVVSLVGRRARKITDSDAIRQIILNAAQIAHGSDFTCFSFAITENLLDFVPHDPFGFTKANGPCLGFVGRRILPDPQMVHYTDCDITLQALLRDRAVWQDKRFAFVHSFQSNVGGGTHMHTTEKSNQMLAVLRRKWGSPGPDRIWDHVVSGGKTRTVAKVTRRQPLEV